MAVQAYLVANPSDANVVVNAKTAIARSVTTLSLDDALIADWPGWGAAGCAILRADVRDESERQEAGYLLQTHSP